MPSIEGLREGRLLASWAPLAAVVACAGRAGSGGHFFTDGQLSVWIRNSDSWRPPLAIDH